MQKYILLIIAFLTINIASNAQVKSVYSEKFTEGNYLILEENYLKALENFLEAYKIDSVNSNINFKIGYCYLKTESSKTLSLRYLAKAVKNTSKHYNDDSKDEKIAPVNAYLEYGRALHLNYKFDEAIANYEKFKSYLDPVKNADFVKEVNRAIDISKYAKTQFAAPNTSIKITNMGDSINSAYPDYSAVLSADENMIIFTSRRPGSTGGDLTDDGQFYEDIYISYKKKDGTWTSAKSISPNINTNEHDASVGLIADGQSLLLYKESNGGDIYESTLQGNDWSFPQPEGSDINSENWETSACLSPDRNTLFFVSNRPGGLGERDIWTCVKLPNGQWSKATNMGAPINTEYDEESPFYHPSQDLLFFSSKGHSTMGGFDIFYSEKTEKGWGEPQNIGYPINTTDDDLYYVTSPDGERGYYSSSLRDEGRGEKDIYQITFTSKKAEALVLIKGVIIPATSCPIPDDITIYATNQESGIISSYKPLLRDGTFTIIIPPNSKYSLSYQQNGEEFDTEEIIVPSDAVYREINKPIHLKPCDGKTVAIDHSLQSGDSTVVKPANIEHTVKSPCSGKKISKDSMISVEGFAYDKDGKPYANKVINLRNGNGEIIKSVTTTSTGGYIYTWLCPEDDYSVSAEDPAIVFGKKSVLRYRNNVNKVVKTVPIGRAHPIARGDNQGDHSPSANVDKLNFEIHYRYNVNEIDVNGSTFMEYLDNLMELYKKNGKLNIEISSSASKVPTRTFGSNDVLAKSRATKVKEQLLTALSGKGVDASKIKFVKINSSVGGPAYSGDYITNKATYEKFQFSKIKAY